MLVQVQPRPLRARLQHWFTTAVLLAALGLLCVGGFVGFALFALSVLRVLP